MANSAIQYLINLPIHKHHVLLCEYQKKIPNYLNCIAAGCRSTNVLCNKIIWRFATSQTTSFRKISYLAGVEFERKNTNLLIQSSNYIYQYGMFSYKR